MATGTTTVGFEEKLWLAADKLRSNMDAAEYKHVVLGLIFLKYVSDSFDEKYRQLMAEGYGDEDVQGFYKEATLAEIEAQDFILTPGRYVGIDEQEEDGEPFEEKMQRLTSELSGMFDESIRLQDEIGRKLGAIGYEI